MGKRKIKNKVHFSFLLLFVWFVFTKNIYSFILFCSTVLTHEFGHYIVAKKLGYKLNNFYIAPYGVCLNYKDKVFQQKDEVLIALAGPCVNFILSIFCVCLWWVFPSWYNFSVDFVFQSLMLGLFNLLPCYPLDGGRVFVGMLSNLMPRKKAVKLTVCLNFTIAAGLLVLFIISCFINFNPSLCICGVFMILSGIENKNECRYEVRDVFDKRVKNYSKPLLLTVNASETLASLVKHIEANKFTIFIIVFQNNKTKLLDEQAVKLLSIKYPLNTIIHDIFRQDKG